MIHSQPDYQRLYEQSHQELARARQELAQMEAQAEKKISGLEQKLALALLEINELRAKLFGGKSDQRVKKAAGREVDVLPLGATIAEVAASEGLLKGDVAQVEKKALEKRKKVPTTRIVLPAHLEREEIIIDPAGDLSEYHIIGEEVTEVLTPDRPGP